MLGRIDELQSLRAALQAADPVALDDARSIGKALRGSGATFGFATLTAVATVVETSADEAVLRRVEGLISELYALIEADGSDAPYHAEWLVRAADLSLESEVLDGVEDATGAWTRVSEASGLDSRLLTDAVARYLDLEAADLELRSRSALSLVPEALMGAGRVVPLRESSTSITVATSEPTSLPMELELERLTGRTPIFVVAPPDAIDAVLATLLEGPRAAHSPLRPPTDELNVRGRRVLVVDDEASARAFIRSLLERRGFEVVEAVDGVEALDMMRRHGPIGLVVADLNMPKMDGLELIWELRAEHQWAHLPVIVVTGEVDEVLETHLLEESADDYIRKPLDPRLFLARVEATIRRSEA
jgi:CheY-like chemotaxis protein